MSTHVSAHPSSRHADAVELENRSAGGYGQFADRWISVESWLFFWQDRPDASDGAKGLPWKGPTNCWVSLLRASWRYKSLPASRT